MKLGRLPREFDPRIPHHGMLKAMLRQAGIARPALLPSCDNSANLPGDVGMMLNDQLGCCTCAGFYHALQLWTQDAQGSELTEPDTMVLDMYRENGYRGGIGDQYDPNTDTGCSEQSVLSYLLNYGAPLEDGTRHRVVAYVELDIENHDDIDEAIQEFGCVYIGFNVPDGLMEDVGGGETMWDDKPSYGGIVGGHCVIAVGFDRSDTSNPTRDIISWGQKNFVMTTSFWNKYVEEAYAIVDPLWIERSGKTPYGLDIRTLEQLMSGLRSASTAAAVDHGAEEAARHGVARSPHWSTVEHEFKQKHPVCAAGGRGPIQVHHINPFHYAIALGRPDLELDENNLIGLTEGPDEENDGEYHLLLGHRGNFKLGNANVRTDANRFHGMKCSVIKLTPEYTAIVPMKALDEMSDDEKKAYRAQMDADIPFDPNGTVATRFGFHYDTTSGNVVKS